jgi:hypothetical protein
MADEGAPSNFAGPVFPNPTGIKPFDSDKAARKADTPVGASMSVQNAPADPDKANGITPHPLIQHFAKKGGPVRRLKSSPAEVHEN